MADLAQVGIYFAFKDESCFCAHINPGIDTPSGDYARSPHFDEGPRLKDLMCSLLRQHCGSPSNLKPDREVIVVCPGMWENKWTSDPATWIKLVSWYIVEGIRAWLADDQENPKVLVCDEEAQGFVVDHRNGDVVKIPINASWAEVTGGVTIGGWHVVPEEASLGGNPWEPSVQREKEK